MASKATTKPRDITNDADTTIPAVSAGKCANCGWHLFKDIEHHCPTRVRPLVVFNQVGAPRVHSSGGNDSGNPRLTIDERYY